MKFYRTMFNTLPEICYMGKEHLIPPTNHVARFAGEYVLYFMLSGKLSLIDNGEAILLEPGDIYIFQKGEYHAPAECTECSYYYLHFEGDFSEVEVEEESELIVSQHNHFLTNIHRNKNYDTQIFLPKLVHIEKASLCKRIERLLEDANLKNSLKKDPYFKTEAALRVQEVMLLMYRFYISEKRKEVEVFGYDMIRNVIAFLEEHSTQSISGAILEEKFGYNFDYMNRKFKKVTGKTIFLYLRKLRINHAVYMLKMQNISISEVAAACGFCDIYYFSRVFKAEIGMTPTQYINRFKS